MKNIGQNGKNMLKTDAKNAFVSMYTRARLSYCNNASEKRSAERLASNASTSEKALERLLVQECEKAGALCLKFSSATQAGYPDRLILADGGKAAWCELKSRGRKPGKLQSMRIEQLRRMGFPTFVADRPEKVMEAVAWAKGGADEV